LRKNGIRRFNAANRWSGSRRSVEPEVLCIEARPFDDEAADGREGDADDDDDDVNADEGETKESIEDTKVAPFDCGMLSNGKR
jgi:hypothetical protein